MFKTLVFQKERQKTAGNGWFGMKAPELTDELKNDLRALKMRAGMDPKRFYKKNDRDGFPKYFQVWYLIVVMFCGEQLSNAVFTIKISKDLHVYTKPELSVS